MKGAVQGSHGEFPLAKELPQIKAVLLCFMAFIFSWERPQRNLRFLEGMQSDAVLIGNPHGSFSRPGTSLGRVALLPCVRDPKAIGYLCPVQAMKSLHSTWELHRVSFDPSSFGLRPRGGEADKSTTSSGHNWMGVGAEYLLEHLSTLKASLWDVH